MLDTCYPKRWMKAGRRGAIPAGRRGATCEDDLRGAIVALFEQVGALPASCTSLPVGATAVASCDSTGCTDLPPPLAVVAA